jgi:hypothetical protein
MPCGTPGALYDAVLSDLHYLIETEDRVILLDAKEQWTPLQCICEEDDYQIGLQVVRVAGVSKIGFRGQEF